MARRRKRKSVIRRLTGFLARLIVPVILAGFGFYYLKLNGLILQPQPEAQSTAEPSSKPEEVNDLPRNEAYYYRFLSEAEQKVYRTILQACENYDMAPSLPNGTGEDAMYHAVTAFTRDCPQYWWVNNTYNYYRNGFGEIVSMEFQSDGNEADRMAEIGRIADAVLADCPGTPYEAYKYLYDWVIDNADYDESAPNGQNLTGVFLDHRAVCAGYAGAYQYLCERAGLFCTYVSGTAVMKDGTSGSHAWNLIRIKDAYYWADTTWGDPMFEGSEAPGTNYNYFCVSDRVINAEHRIDTALRNSEERVPLNAEYPACSDDSYDWYVRNGAYFETYDPEAVRQYILGVAAEGGRAELKFGSPEALLEAVNDLISNEAFFRILQEAGIRCTSLSYVLFEPIGAVWIMPG